MTSSTATIDRRQTVAPSRTAVGSVRDWVEARAGVAAEAGSVLVHAPTSAFQAPGGGENQLLQTARHLDAAGVPVRLFCPWTDRIEGARLLHLFGMSREGLELARIARRRGVPVALSPICWLEPRALVELAPGRVKGLVDLAKWSLKGVVPALRGWRDDLIRLADVILPNSEAEADQLVRLFRADRGRVRVIPNGVDPRFAGADPSSFRRAYGPGEFVLYAGRIEPRKNVLRLVRAARRAGRPVVLIGDAPPGHEPYRDACLSEGRGSVRHFGAVDHDDPFLASAYGSARVFAMPSWFETPGLSALEAALAGAAVAITPNGCTREYFGDYVSYARPESVRDIAGAIGRAWAVGPSPGLSARIATTYLWPDIARRTAEAYDSVAC